MIRRTYLAGAALTLITGLGSSAASPSNLIIDGGFENPAPPSTTPAGSPGQGYTLENIGSTFGGAWTVGYTPGATGYSSDSVALTPSVEYASPNIFYNAASGNQSLDLIGALDNGHPAGVYQTVATTAGTQYTLAFSLGS